MSALRTKSGLSNHQKIKDANNVDTLGNLSYFVNARRSATAVIAARMKMIGILRDAIMLNKRKFKRKSRWFSSLIVHQEELG